MPKLYTHPFSTFCRRVHLALLEKGIDWDHEVVDMAKGAHRKPEYLAISPYGRVPALQDGGLTLYESTAILGYLESIHPEPTLVPSDLGQKAKMWMYIKACDLQFARPTGTIIFPKRFIPEDKWRKDEMAKASKTIQRHLSVIEPVLDGQAFMMGEQFTLADVCYLPFLQFLPILDVEVPPNIERWSKALFDRPTAQKTIPPDAPKW